MGLYKAKSQTRIFNQTILQKSQIYEICIRKAKLATQLYIWPRDQFVSYVMQGSKYFTQGKFPQIPRDFQTSHLSNMLFFNLNLLINEYFN